MTETNEERKHLKPRQVHKGVFTGDMTGPNIALAVFTLLANILIIYFMFNTTRFSRVSKSIFILANVIALAALITLNVVNINAFRSKKKSMFAVGSILCILLCAIGAYGSYAAARVNKNVDKITNTTVEESVSTSFVIYNSENSLNITSVAQLDGMTVGYANGTHTAELGQKQLKNEGINASFHEYQDYSSLALALFGGEVDCAILPTNYKSLFQNETGMTASLEKTSSLMDFEETVTVSNNSGADKDITKEPFTVLLIGNADGLSDTMIVCSVNPISMEVTMSSMARDSYVPISCYGGGYSKLNASRAVSKQCTIDTIESLVGVDIDYYVEVNFDAVVEIVDALGGIVVNSPISFVGQSSSSQRGHYTVWVPAGDNVLLNGEQALAFARERYLFASGDFARQQHQQEVIEAMVRTIMRTRDVNTFLKVLDAAGNNIQTNFTVDQMTSFMRYAIQKTNRYYDQEHSEKVFQIRTSRVTGYSSNLWDSGSKILLYIYRLWNGSLADTRNAIIRNTDLNSAITAASDRLKWSINWEYTPDPISYDLYAEAMIPGDTVPAEYACGENAYMNQDGNCTCNEGFEGDATQGCVVIPEQTPAPTPTPTPTPSATPELSEKEQCEADSNNIWYNDACILKVRYECEVNSNGIWDSETNSCKTTAQTSTPDTSEEESKAAEEAQKAAEEAARKAAEEEAARQAAEEAAKQAEQACLNNGSGYTWDGSNCIAPAPAENTAVPESEQVSETESVDETDENQSVEDSSDSDTSQEG